MCDIVNQRFSIKHFKHEDSNIIVNAIIAKQKGMILKKMGTDRRCLGFQKISGSKFCSLFFSMY